MYEKYFNLRTKPFELVPNPAFLYMSRTHKKAIHYLYYGIRERAGFILLTGEVGSGKTTLITDLIKRVDRNVILAKIFNTKVNSEQLIAMINDDFGLEVKGKDKVQLLKDLNDFVIEQHARGNNPVLIIDEAQNLQPDLLEEIRMLSNLETDRAKLLQIVLVGQPELREILSVAGLRQLRQRISINCRIVPLTKEETLEYILHRLEVAGNRDAVAFKDGSVDVIFEYCKGIPRLTNILCDFLLLTAFNEDTKDVDSAMVHDIAKDLEFESLYWGKQDSPLKQSVDYTALLNALGIGGVKEQ
jgi:putative secretion ATPase (PEP-CTERM system associated)